MPRFSPDGNWIAYHVGGTLRPCSLYVVAATGGKPRKVETGVNWDFGPVWSPDSTHILFEGTDDFLAIEKTDWWVVPAAGGRAVATGALPVLRQQRLGPSASITVDEWLPGQLHFSARFGSGANLWALPIASGTWKAKGPATPVTSGSGTEVHPRFASGADGAARVVFGNLSANSDLWSLPVDADQAKVTGELRKLTEGTAENNYPTLS